jgi:hypothetical protein
MSDQINNRISYLVKWTKRELATIQQTIRPIVCLQLKNGDVKVGTIMVENNDNVWTSNLMKFTYKKAAIYYSILLQLKRYNEADNLRMIDYHLSTLENDENIFNARLLEAEKKRDWFKYDLIENRLSSIQHNITSTRHEMDKVIRHATYLNRAPVN